MLEPLRETLLHKKRIILASSSPRRSELLRNMGLKFEIIPSTFEENLRASDFLNHGAFAIATAHQKVKEVDLRLRSDPVKPDLIIGADTVVSFQGKILGKPKNKSEAFKHLKLLNGNQHTVYTGVVLKTPVCEMKFFESTRVYMTEMDDLTIMGYIATDEPMDKAGAYGIQGFGGSIIEKIDGDYFNVAGLPLNSFCKHMLKLYK